MLITVAVLKTPHFSASKHTPKYFVMLVRLFALALLITGLIGLYDGRAMLRTFISSGVDLSGMIHLEMIIQLCVSSCVCVFVCTITPHCLLRHYIEKELLS